MDDMTINKPVIIFNFAYDIYTEPKGESTIAIDHPEMMGTINDDGSVLYPAIENIKEFLMKELVTSHKLKQFRIADSTFCVFSPKKYIYLTYDFSGFWRLAGSGVLADIEDGEPTELINGIIRHVNERAGGK